MILDFEKLSGTTAKHIITAMLEKNIISEDVIRNCLKGDPPVELKHLVDNVHQIFCLDHGTGISPCAYYEEEGASIDQIWTQPEHQKWLEHTFKLMENLKFSNQDDFLKLYAKAKEMQEKLTKFKNESPEAWKLLSYMNEWKNE